MTTTTSLAPDDHDTDPFADETIEWTGGVLRPWGKLEHAGKPMRIAAWIDTWGRLIGAAIVEGHGPTVLRELLEELLVSVPEERRPSRLVVWPCAQSTFRDVAYPPVKVEKDGFLRIVVDDQVCFGFIPGRLPIRRGVPNRRRV